MVPGALGNTGMAEMEVSGRSILGDGHILMLSIPGKPCPGLALHLLSQLRNI